MKMREKTELETTEEIPLAELERQDQDEGQLIGRDVISSNLNTVDLIFGPEKCS